MKKRIVIVGSANTKSEQLAYLKEKIEFRGHEVILMDVGMGGKAPIKTDVTSAEIARKAGRDIRDIIASKDRFDVTNAMSEGARLKALDLLSEGKLDGIVALGGATIALIGSKVMAALPFGIPKVLAVPAAMPAYVSEWFGAKDVTVMQVILEIAGMNDLMKNAISQIAGAISGMVDEAFSYNAITLPSPSIAITEIGFSDQCAKNVEKLLVEKGYPVFIFHAQGVSDRAMDALISQGFFDAVVDIVPAGLIEERFKGNRRGGMERLDAAGKRGIPQVWAPCCLNITGAGPTRVNREKYEASGRVYKIDAMRAMARFPMDELLIGAKLYAEKINAARGPIKLVVPLKGWSSLDREGSVLYDPAQDRLFIEELKKHLTVSIDIEEVDCNLEEMATAETLVNGIVELLKSENSLKN